MTVKRLHTCCLTSLSKMSHLEQVSIVCSRQPVQPLFYPTLWACLLDKLPQLKVLTRYQLVAHWDPCLTSTLVALRDRQRPFRLRRLGVNLQNPQTCDLPAHLLPEVTNLTVFCGTNFTINMSLAAPRLDPLLQLAGSVTSLKLSNLSAEMNMHLVRGLGAQLKELQVKIEISFMRRCAKFNVVGNIEKA